MVGTVTVQRHTPWEELGQSLNDLLTNHLQLLCKGWDLWEDPVLTDAPLGLSPDSMASVTIGKELTPHTSLSTILALCASPC